MLNGDPGCPGALFQVRDCVPGLNGAGEWDIRLYRGCVPLLSFELI